MRICLTLATLIVALAITSVGRAERVHNLPPSHRLMHPGPGVGGPGPGVLPPPIPPAPPGMGMGMGFGMPHPSIQVMFRQPESMQVRWDVGGGRFDSEPLIVPGRNNFPQGGIYRLKLTNIEGREGVELYPTLEVGPATPRTEAYLAHNAIPVQFTAEDFDQVLTGNFVTKVIYLPDPEFQQLALAGVDTLVSTRLDPGVDPIVEADRRGSIMAVIRLGNKDIESQSLGMGGYGGGGGIMPISHMGGYGAAPMGGYGAAPMGGYGGAPMGGYGGAPMGGYGGAPMGGYGAAPMGPASFGPTGVMPNYISGLTSPQYGMPITGTPIGLPGPPHIPLGVPAGLQKHVMKNHTPIYMPGPVEKFNIHVRQQPGYSYPQPPNTMHVLEQNIHPPQRYHQPHYDMHRAVR